VTDCKVTILGAGPYGLSAAAYLRAAGIETRVFGEPMSFWDEQMPAGMFLRSSWDASHISDPAKKLTLDSYRSSRGNHMSAPVELNRFVDYGRWFLKEAKLEIERRKISCIDSCEKGFRIELEDGETFTSERVGIAAGISQFVARPIEFDAIPSALASHSSEHRDLGKFNGQRVAVIGCGQSALESAALLHEAGASVEVIARASNLNWVGLHSWLHKLGPISKIAYSNRDVGPAGISRLVAMPNVFRKFSRNFQDRVSYRAIRPAGSSWLQPRLKNFPITLGRRVLSAAASPSALKLALDDGTQRQVDHAILATGFRVDVSKYKFLSEKIRSQLKTTNGYPELSRGLESSIPGLHFLGRPAARSFGPLLCFVSGTEFASTELLRTISRERRNE
jgi:FAD-dependent urate hydroxylase